MGNIRASDGSSFENTWISIGRDWKRVVTMIRKDWVTVESIAGALVLCDGFRHVTGLEVRWEPVRIADVETI